MKQKFLVGLSLVLPAIATVVAFSVPVFATDGEVDCGEVGVRCEYDSKCFSPGSCLKTGCDPQKQQCKMEGVWDGCGSCGGTVN